MRFSKAFTKKWIDYFGYEPDKESISKMIDESIIVQNFRVIRKKDGSVYKVAQIRWNVDENILFKLDTDTNTVITFVADKRMYGGAYARV